jgi:hypothetical protein
MKKSKKIMVNDGHFAFGDRYFVRCQISDALWERLYEMNSMDKLELVELWDMLIETNSKIIIYDKKLYLAHLIVYSVFTPEEIFNNPHQFLQLVNALTIDPNKDIFQEYQKLLNEEITMDGYLANLVSMKYKNRELAPLKKKAQSLLTTAINPHLNVKQTLYYENGKYVLSIGSSERGEVEALNQACNHLSKLFSYVLSVYQNGTEHEEINNNEFKEASQILNFFPKENIEMFLGMDDIISLTLLKNYCEYC